MVAAIILRVADVTQIRSGSTRATIHYYYSLSLARAPTKSNHNILAHIAYNRLGFILRGSQNVATITI